jgi:hypothetical protein
MIADDREIWFFDVDACLVDSLTGTSLRPLARPILESLRDRGALVVWWSAGGEAHARRLAQALGVDGLVGEFHAKEHRGPDGRWSFPPGLRPQVCVDDRPEDAPACALNVAVSPYLAPDPHDRGLRPLHHLLACPVDI